MSPSSCRSCRVFERVSLHARGSKAETELRSTAENSYSEDTLRHKHRQGIAFLGQLYRHKRDEQDDNIAHLWLSWAKNRPLCSNFTYSSIEMNRQISNPRSSGLVPQKAVQNHFLHIPDNRYWEPSLCNEQVMSPECSVRPAAPSINLARLGFARLEWRRWRRFRACEKRLQSVKLDRSGLSLIRPLGHFPPFVLHKAEYYWPGLKVLLHCTFHSSLCIHCTTQSALHLFLREDLTNWALTRRLCRTGGKGTALPTPTLFGAKYSEQFISQQQAIIQ